MSKKTIAVVAGHPLHPNMKAELLTLGKILDGNYKRHLIVGVQETPEYLKKRFDLVFDVETSVYDFRSLRYTVQACRKYLNYHKPTVILNIAQQIPIGFAVAIIGSWKRATTLLRVAGESLRLHELETTLLGYIRKWIVHRLGVKVAGHLADHVLTLGPVLRNQILNAGIDSVKVHTLPNLFDYRRFKASSEPKEVIRDEIGLDPSLQTVLFVGRVSEIKGADRLLEIVQSVLKESDDIQFCIVGGGPLLPKFHHFPSSRVHLPGRVPYSKIPNYYRASDLLIHPSKTEGLPNVVLEAIAAKLPIMAAPVGEVEQYVPITASDPQAYVEYILRGEWEPPEYPDWFDWEVLREQYLSFFDDIATKEPRGT